MESSNRLLLLAATLGACLALSGCQTIKGWFGKNDVEKQQTEDQAAAEEEAEDTDSTPPRVIEPNVARRKIKTPKIDNENWELGGGVGFAGARTRAGTGVRVPSARGAASAGAGQALSCRPLVSGSVSAARITTPYAAAANTPIAWTSVIVCDT